MSEYKAIIKVPVGEKWVNIAFLLLGFSLLGREVKVNELIEHDEALLEEIKALSKSRKNADKERAEELLGQLKIPEFVEPYVENKSKSAIFEIVDDRAAAEVTVEESKFDLTKAIEERDARIADLESKLAQANSADAEGATDSNEGKEAEDV